MASRYSSSRQIRDSYKYSSEDFFDITVLEDEIEYSAVPESRFTSSENVNPNHGFEPQAAEGWEFIPTGFVPTSEYLPQNEPSKLSTLPFSKRNFLDSLRPLKLGKRVTLPHLLNPKRSAQAAAFNTYDIVDPFEAPSTEAVEQELAQCLLHESVVIDECHVDPEDELMAASVQQSTHFRKRRGSRETFLARSDSRWQAAVNAIKLSIEDDQQLCGVWLLSEVNHWDNESERVVVLLYDSILIARYNFYTKVLMEVRSIGLSGIYAITHGPFQSPSPIFKQRPGIGVRLHWNKDAPLSLAQKWNPWSEKIPFTTFGPHPSTYDTVQCSIEGHLDISSFLTKLKECLKIYSTENDTDVLFNEVDSLPPQSSKFGIIQQIHNSAKLGCDTSNPNFT